MNWVFDAIQSMTVAEILSVVFSLFYVIGAAKEKAWCWPMGIIGCCFWFYSAWFEYNLEIDALLQIYYIGVSIYGWRLWTKQAKQNAELKITSMSMKQHALVITPTLLLSLVIGYLFSEYRDTASPYWDAITTCFSIVITFLVTRKYLENWLYWVVIDLIYIFLYKSQEANLFSALFILYCVIAIIGYVNWKKQHQIKL